MKKIGHTIHTPSPDIVPLRSSYYWVKNLSGTSLSFMKITFFCDEKKAFSKTGKILFTHFGVSGPLILNSSRQVNELLDNGHVTAEIDLFPDTDRASLEKRILKTFDQTKNKNIRNSLYEFIPRKMADIIHDMMRLEDTDKKVHSITVEERKKLIHLIKHFPMTIDGLMGFDRAVVADGGIPLSEINTKTMQSKVLKNLYITGDMLHINRPSGGYSLQLCWTTGYVVGMNIPDTSVPVIKTIKADYTKRSKGDMKAVATLTKSQISAMHANEKGETSVKVTVTDGEGKEPIIVEMVWAWTPKKR